MRSKESVHNGRYRASETKYVSGSSAESPGNKPSSISETTILSPRRFASMTSPPFPANGSRMISVAWGLAMLYRNRASKVDTPR